MHLVSVELRLEWTLNFQAEVVSLGGGELGELDAKVVEVETGNLLVEDLGEDIDTDIEFTTLAELNILAPEGLVFLLEEQDLGEDLVGEGAAHDERGVASGTTQVDETALSEEDDVVAVGKLEAVDLWLDVDNVLSVSLEPGDVDFNVEVTNVADDSIVFHLLEVFSGQDVTASSGGDEDLTDGSSLLHGSDLETGDGGLEGVDGIDLSDDDTGTHSVESHGATLTDVTVSGNNGDLTSNHDISSTLDTVNERLTASVQVIELGLGDGVIDIDSWDEELLVLEHAVEVVNTSGGLLRETVASLEHLGVLGVNEGGEITTVIQDEVEGLSILEGKELLLQAPVVLLLSLTLPGENWDTGGGNGSSSMVLCGEDVAGGPGDFSTESSKGLDEDGSLDGHVETTGDTGTSKRLLSSILGSGGHETRHFIFGKLDFPAAEGGKGDIGDLELLGWGTHDGWMDGFRRDKKGLIMAMGGCP